MNWTRQRAGAAFHCSWDCTGWSGHSASLTSQRKTSEQRRRRCKRSSRSWCQRGSSFQRLVKIKLTFCSKKLHRHWIILINDCISSAKLQQKDKVGCNLYLMTLNILKLCSLLKRNVFLSFNNLPPDVHTFLSGTSWCFLWSTDGGCRETERNAGKLLCQMCKVAGAMASNHWHYFALQIVFEHVVRAFECSWLYQHAAWVWKKWKGLVPDVFQSLCYCTDLVGFKNSWHGLHIIRAGERQV